MLIILIKKLNNNTLKYSEAVALMYLTSINPKLSVSWKCNLKPTFTFFGMKNDHNRQFSCDTYLFFDIYLYTANKNVKLARAKRR